jgi:GH43 family beta-xylosidase
MGLVGWFSHRFLPVFSLDVERCNSWPDRPLPARGKFMNNPNKDGQHPTFRNPLNNGPDPFLTFYNGRYYLSTTAGNVSLPMWAAPSLSELATASPITIWSEADHPERASQLWAPSFYLIDGHWYLYYTADDGNDANHRIYVAQSVGSDPLGPYSFTARLATPIDDLWAIDPALLRWGGELYILWCGAGHEGHNLLYIAPMSNPWTISGPRVYLPAAGGCPEVREAPSVIYHNDSAFLIYSTCDTGKPDYQLWMKILPAGANPLEAAQWRQHPGPVFTRYDPAGVYGPGSNAFFRSPDGQEDWIVYHAKTTSAYTYDGRTTRAQKITWKADGSPNLGAPIALDVAIPLPSGDPSLAPID